MRRLGLIGCGRIGEPVAKALQEGRGGDWSLVSILTRQQVSIGNMTTEVDPDAFFNQNLNLIIDTAGPGSMTQYGVRALSLADMWTVNAAALADPVLFHSLQQSAKENGHRLRLLTGAIAGLDGISTFSEDNNVKVKVSVDLAPGSGVGKTLFRGSLAEAAEQYPTSVNVAVAAGLAAGGLDRAQIEVRQPGFEQARKLGLEAESRYGSLKVETIPNMVPHEGINMVSASIIAALRRENQTIWVG
jgi:aspartate dehydrogenase